MAISRELWRAVKTARRPHYKLAAEIGMHPSRFSQLLSGDLNVPFGDWRVVKLARLVGVPTTRAFEDEPPLRLVPQPASPDPDGDRAGIPAEDHTTH
jgi:hypothetical protein